jgi:hypothetical protein
VFRRILHLLTLCIASLVLLVSAPAHASIPASHQGAKTALSAPSFAVKRIKGKKPPSAYCTYRAAVATAGTHKGKVVAIAASCGGTPSVWGWPGQNPIRYRDPTGHMSDENFDPDLGHSVPTAGPMSTGEKIVVAGMAVPWVVAGGGLAFTAIRGWLGFAVPTIGAAGQKLNDSGCSANANRFSPEQTQGLRDLFGRSMGGVNGLLDRLRTGESVSLPQGVTPETLRAYRDVAAEAIAAGKDTLGVQQARQEAIDLLLEQLGK